VVLSECAPSCTAAQPVRRFLSQLIDLIWIREIDPGKVFNLELRSLLRP
jgi:hypothetical protein